MIAGVLCYWDDPCKDIHVHGSDTCFVPGSSFDHCIWRQCPLCHGCWGLLVVDRVQPLHCQLPVLSTVLARSSATCLQMRHTALLCSQGHLQLLLIILHAFIRQYASPVISTPVWNLLLVAANIVSIVRQYASSVSGTPVQKLLLVGCFTCKHIKAVCIICRQDTCWGV